MLKGYNGSAAITKIKSNFHTHNYLCGHAGGTVCDYVEQAVKYGLEEIGISDHCIPPIDSYEPYITPKTLITRYLPQFNEARKKFGDKIKIYAGVEIEYFCGHDEYYEQLLKSIDYMVLGEHEYFLGSRRKNSFCDGVNDENVEAYFEAIKKGMATGYFSLVAHPDLIFYRRPKITERMRAAFDGLVRAAVRCDVPLELNANGIRNHRFVYPSDLLVELCKKYDAKVIISSDSHSPYELIDDCVFGLYDYAKRNKLNLVDTIKFPKIGKRNR